MATLGFFADALTPDAVSRILGVKPESAAAKGEPFPRQGAGDPIIARTGTWFVTTEGRRLGNRPEDHLMWVVNLAKDHWPALRQQIPGIRADLSLQVHAGKFDPMDIPRDLLKMAVSIGELEIEVPARGIDLFLNARNLAGAFRKVAHV